MEVIPLLRRRMVFLQIKFLSPRIRLRRPADRSLPRFPRVQRIAGQHKGGLVFRIDRLLVQNAVIDLVDESRIEHPSLQIKADFTIDRSAAGDSFYMKGSGHFDGDGDTGKFSLDGNVGNGTNLNLRVSHLPLGLVTVFWPDLAPWGGSLGVTGTLCFESDHKWAWAVSGNLKDLRHLPTDTPLPLQLEGDFRSASPSTLRAVWVSTSSDVRAEVHLNDFQHRRLQVQVSGKNLDLMEISPFLSLSYQLHPVDKMPAGLPVDGESTGAF